jgi:hypothetical protein
MLKSNLLLKSARKRCGAIVVGLIGLMLFGCEKPEESEAFLKLKKESARMSARQEAEITRLNAELIKAKDQRDGIRASVAQEMQILKDHADLMDRLMNDSQLREIQSVERQIKQMKGER